MVCFLDFRRKQNIEVDKIRTSASSLVKRKLLRIYRETFCEMKSFLKKSNSAKKPKDEPLD